MSPRTLFEMELSRLREDLKNMCLQVEEEYDSLFSALSNQDRDMLLTILDKDQTVRDMEKRIEARCLLLITRQHPIARDLRTVSAGLKVVTDIRRVGDHVTDMAELILRIGMQDISQYSGHLPDMITAARELLHDAVEAFLKRNKEEAEKVILGDDRVDELFNLVKEELVEHLKEDCNVDDCVDVLMIAKYLEKIGDHAVNVGEWEIFQETGDMRSMRLL